MSKLRRNNVKEKGISRRKGVNSGFTLVELLVVVAIIALLMSILMPALRRVKMQAEEVKCKANLRQIGMILYMYLQEEDFKFPDFWPGTNAPNGFLWSADGTAVKSKPAKSGIRRYQPGDSTRAYWGVWFNSYVKDIDIFGCPAMTQFAEMIANSPIYDYRNYLAPSVSPADVVKTAAFGLNGYLANLNVNSVKNQAEVIICTDHVEPRNEQAHENNRGDCFCVGVGDGRDVNLTHYRPASGGTKDDPRNDHYRGIFRHNIRRGEAYRTGGRADVLWMDGQVNPIEETYGWAPDPYYANGEYVPNRWYDPRGTGNGGWLDLNRAPPTMGR